MKKHVLEKYREQAGLTQESLAETLGVSRQLVGLIEMGERRVSPEKALEWELLIPITKEELCPEIFRPASAANAIASSRLILKKRKALAQMKSQ